MTIISSVPGPHPLSSAIISGLKTARKNLSWVRSHGIKVNEADTRRALVDPVLDGLGWPMRNMGHVFFEHPLNTRDTLDYVLSREQVSDATQARRHGIVVEAKSAREPLKSKDYDQLASYVTQMAVPWGLLTNGRIWALVDGSKHLDLAEDRVVWSLDIDNWSSVLAATWQWSSISFATDTIAAVDEHDRELVEEGISGDDVRGSDIVGWTHIIAPPGRGSRAIIAPNDDGSLARLRENDDGTFDILPGSYVLSDLSQSLRSAKLKSYLQRVLAGRRLGRPEISEQHAGVLRLTEPIRGLSPSAAAAIVLGRVANGHVEGRRHNTKDNRNDKDILLRDP